MGSRAKFLTGVLGICVLLLGVAWLAELPPLFAPAEEQPQSTEPPALPPASPDEVEEADGTGDAPAQHGDPSPQPGLKAKAPARPPEPAQPPPGPEEPVAPVRPDAVLPGTAQPPAADDPGPVPLPINISGKEVMKSIDKAVAWLIKKQARNGSWGDLRDVGAYTQFHDSEPVTQAAGPTALAVYTLLRAKQPVKHPAVRKAFQFLRRHHKLPATSMESAMLLLAVTATADGSVRRKTDRPRIQGIYRGWATKLVDHLVEKRKARGWRYNVTGRVEPLQVGGAEDLVSTHLAALALFSAHRLGIRTKDRVWEDILRYTLEQQEGATLHRPDPKKPRGFAYIQGHPVSDEGLATGGTTACGIAVLRMGMHVLSDSRLRDRLKERDPVLHDTVALSLPAAEVWIQEHWSPYANPGKKNGAKVLHHHWLWALETAQDLHPDPVKLLGNRNWYADVARELVNRQRKDGHWRVQGSWDPADVLDTCFAILFLKRATRGLVR